VKLHKGISVPGSADLSNGCRVVFAIVCVAGLTGCAHAKHDTWQAPRGELSAVLKESVRWLPLSTNLYARVEDSKQPQAVSLLQDSPWRLLNKEETTSFTPNLPLPADGKLASYLVRGLSCSSHPVWTRVQFDDATGRLVVRQATWNGELFPSFLWKSEPNALVVLLPRAPAVVYPAALLGGDGIDALGTDHR
jgi:hypothetical protein